VHERHAQLRKVGRHRPVRLELISGVAPRSAPSGGVDKAMLHAVNSCLIGVSYRKQDEEKYSQIAAFYWLV
jgi:hypothetical protein